MPVFSLPGPYGIGCFSREAYSFVDFLEKSGQRYWQILPIGPTGYGDSPYQSFSTFAGNPYFIDLETLIGRGLLERGECGRIYGGIQAGRVDYGLMYSTRIEILKKAYLRWKDSGICRDDAAAFAAFKEKNSYWIYDYCMFMALKEHCGGAPFQRWDAGIRYREHDALARAGEELADEIGFHEYIQFEFERQWLELKAYANRKNISIIGDIPIYVSSDSADFWAAPEMFRVGPDNMPTAVAGVPPDGFSADGQVWGNPLYNWEKHKASGYDWWLRRMGRCRELYDVIRIDHFRGFDEYFCVPPDAGTAAEGRWEKGPGIELFTKIKSSFPGIRIIAEDLGYMSDSVKKLVADTGFPNMKILEFAFDSRDEEDKEPHMPYSYDQNCVVYTGTHDNETLTEWMSNILPAEKKKLQDYLWTDSGDAGVLTDRAIRLLQSSHAVLCMIPIWDWLGLGSEARINRPGTCSGSWTWRAEEDMFTGELAERMLHIASLYGRTEGGAGH